MESVEREYSQFSTYLVDFGKGVLDKAAHVFDRTPLLHILGRLKHHCLVLGAPEEQKAE